MEDQTGQEISKKARIGAGIIGLAFLLAVFTELSFTLMNVCYGYGKERESSILLPAQIAGFEPAGDFFIRTGESSFLEYTLDQAYGSMELNFPQPLEKEVELDFYYREKAESEYSRFRKKTFFFMRGTTKGRISFSGKNMEGIRLTFYETVPAIQAQFNKKASVKELTGQEMWEQFRFSRFLELWAGFFFLCVRIRQKTGKSKLKQIKRQDREKSETVREKCREDFGVKKRERLAYLDLVRTLAALFTIALHVVEPTALMQTPQTARSLVFHAAVIVLFTCNLLFFFLSGALLLPVRDESAKTFYLKRGKKIVIPFLIVSVFYLRGMCGSEIGFVPWLNEAVRDIFRREIRMAPHFWLVYELMGVYLLVPLLRLLIQKLSERGEKFFVKLIVLELALRTVFMYRGGAGTGMGMFSSYAGIFMMGYFLNRPWMRRYDGGIFAAGIVSFMLSLCTVAAISDYKPLVCNRSFLMLCMASAVFVLCIRSERYLKKIQGILAFFGKYSYLMLLIHWFVYRNIVSYGWIPERWIDRSIGQLVLPFLLITAVSLVISVVIEKIL